MNRFVTVRNGSKEFTDLIHGNHSPGYRPVPLQELRFGEPKEDITFELIPVSQLPQLSGLQVMQSFLKLSRLLLIFFPVFYFLLLDWNHPKLTTFEVLLICLGLISSLAAIQIKVDIADYISGYDRIRGIKGQKVFSSGARTVGQVQRHFKFLFFLACVCGILPILLEPLRAIAVLGAAVFFHIGHEKGVVIQNRLLRDLCLSFVAGPCLAFGILPEIKSLFFGLIWGLFVFFQLQVENFEHSFAQIQAREKNLMTIYPFDQSLRILWKLWGICLVGYVMFRSLNSQLAVWIGSILILVVLSLSWRRQLFQLKSPAGSDIEKVSKIGRQLFMAFISLWSAELIFTAFVAPLVFVWFK